MKFLKKALWKLNKQYLAIAWNFLVLITTSFLAISIPLELEYHIFNDPLLNFFNYLAYLIYLLDILIGLNNAYRPVTGKLTQNNQTKRDYIRKWLIVDVLALLPFHIIFNNPYLILLRLLKVPKVLSFMQRFRYLAIKYSTTYTLTYFIFWLIHLSHWVSCGWLDLIKEDPNVDAYTNYIRALYWSVTTLTTVGFGDITPNLNNNAQMIYTMIVQIMGVGVYGYVIGNVAGLISKNDPAKIAYLDNIEKLRALIKSRSLPPELHRKLRDYFTYIWQNRLGYDEADFLEKLPENLQHELNKHLKNEIVKKIDIFEGAGEDFIEEVAMFLEPELLTPGDLVFEKGDYGSALYFLVNGLLEVIDEEENVINTMQSGEFFGEIALFMQTPRTATIRAITYCDLYKLKKQELDKVIKHYPYIAKKIKKEAMLRQQRYF